MSIREHLLIGMELRAALEDPEVSAALGSIGVLPKILELHAPPANAKNTNGLGETLCGIRGTRHAIITCKRCLNKLVGHRMISTG